MPDNVRSCGETVQIKLLCGADLLESFGTPGLWADDDVSKTNNFWKIYVINFV